MTPVALVSVWGVLLGLLLPVTAQAADLTVFAAASLRDALGAAVTAFERQSGLDVATSFASSGILARQIEKGAPADVYLSANPKWMDYLEDHGRIVPASRLDLLHNRLVLVAPRNSEARDSEARTTINPGFALARMLDDGRLAMGNPAHVPAGSYARQALQHLGVWPAVRPKAAFADNVRSALALVTRAGAPLGVVYRTDALASEAVRVVDTFPPDSHAPITYPVARVAHEDVDQATRAAAERLLIFLQTARTRAIFSDFGFDARL